MSCAGRVDQYGNIAHLHERDTTIAVVSRAPIEKIARWKRQDGLDVPLVLELRQPLQLRLRRVVRRVGRRTRTTTTAPPTTGRRAGSPARTGELHGTSVFLRDGDRVFHTYSAYGRGTEQVGGTHYYLDMTPLGRQEDWEEPAGRARAFKPRADQPGAGEASAARPGWPTPPGLGPTAAGGTPGRARRADAGRGFHRCGAKSAPGRVLPA